MAGLTLRAIDGIGKVSAADWDLCAGADNPFISHAFLAALENSGSASGESGWQPSHLLVEDAAGTLLAAAPLYVKAHSYGEYVFDWGWAEAWERSGRNYYPKLQSSVPFTPVGGRRLLVRPGEDQPTLRGLLADAMRGMTERFELSSAHVTFLPEDEAMALEAKGWLLRIGEQFHWRNQGYASFEDFLAALSSRKRKAIRKEREKAAELGVEVSFVSGADLKPSHWDAFFRFYMNTSDRKWGQAYLNREFFEQLTGPLADQVVLMLAQKDGDYVAGALNFLGGDTLYGRNWGGIGDFRFLHFELCYYRAIDFAIERGLKVVEAGAQGEHKISRGYLPVPTYSVHWIREAPFRSAVADFLKRERLMMQHQMAAQMQDSPFRSA